MTEKVTDMYLIVITSKIDFFRTIWTDEFEQMNQTYISNKIKDLFVSWLNQLPSWSEFSELNLNYLKNYSVQRNLFYHKFS